MAPFASPSPFAVRPSRLGKKKQKASGGGASTGRGARTGSAFAAAARGAAAASSSAGGDASVDSEPAVLSATWLQEGAEEEAAAEADGAGGSGSAQIAAVDASALAASDDSERAAAAAKARATMKDVARLKEGAAAFKQFLGSQLQPAGAEKIATATAARVKPAELLSLRVTQFRAFKALAKLKALPDVKESKDQMRDGLDGGEQHLAPLQVRVSAKASSIVDKYIFPKTEGFKTWHHDYLPPHSSAGASSSAGALTNSMAVAISCQGCVQSAGGNLSQALFQMRRHGGPEMWTRLLAEGSWACGKCRKTLHPEETLKERPKRQVINPAYRGAHRRGYHGYYDSDSCGNDDDEEEDNGEPMYIYKECDMTCRGCGVVIAVGSKLVKKSPYYNNNDVYCVPCVKWQKLGEGTCTKCKTETSAGKYHKHINSGRSLVCPACFGEEEGKRAELRAYKVRPDMRPRARRPRVPANPTCGVCASRAPCRPRPPDTASTSPSSITSSGTWALATRGHRPCWGAPYGIR